MYKLYIYKLYKKLSIDNVLYREHDQVREREAMKNITTKTSLLAKQRLTAFVDPILVKRAKVRGALENLTISEVVEKALDAYAPIIDFDEGKRVKVTFAKKGMSSSTLVKSLLQVQKAKTNNAQDASVDRP